MRVSSGCIGFHKSGESDVALEIQGGSGVGNWSCAGDTTTNSGGSMGSLSGKLVFKDGGSAFLAIDGSGDAELRGKLRKYVF